MAFQDVSILVQPHFFFCPQSNKAKGDFKSAGRNYDIFSVPCDRKSIWKASVPVFPRQCLDNIHQSPKRQTNNWVHSLWTPVYSRKFCHGRININNKNKKISKPNGCISYSQTMRRWTKPHNKCCIWFKIHTQKKCDCDLFWGFLEAEFKSFSFICTSNLPV